MHVHVCVTRKRIIMEFAQAAAPVTRRLYHCIARGSAYNITEFERTFSTFARISGSQISSKDGWTDLSSVISLYVKLDRKVGAGPPCAKMYDMHRPARL